MKKRAGIPLAAVLTAVLVGALSLPAHAKATLSPTDEDVPEATSRRVLLLERTTPGPSSFSLTVSASAGDQGAFIGSLFATLRKGRIVEATPGHATSFGRDEGPDTYSPGSSTCYVGTCSGSGNVGFQFIQFDDDGTDPTNRVFVALEGQVVDHDFEATGWTIRKVAWDFRYIDGRDADATGVAVAGSGAEIFRETSAPGGRFGSLGMGIPPCSGATSGVVRRGAGELALDGGVETKTTRCPPADSGPNVASWANAKTTWNFAGTMVGDTTLSHTRLFVIDLPRGFIRR